MKDPIKYIFLTGVVICGLIFCLSIGDMWIANNSALKTIPFSTEKSDDLKSQQAFSNLSKTDIVTFSKNNNPYSGSGPDIRVTRTPNWHYKIEINEDCKVIHYDFTTITLTC